MARDSYSEIIEMQRQAMRRVENINRQAKQSLETEEAEQNVKPSVVYTPREPKHTSLPVNFPKREEKKEEVKLPELNDDTDRAMILSLLLLLHNEGADELLTLALLYILA